MKEAPSKTVHVKGDVHVDVYSEVVAEVPVKRSDYSKKYILCATLLPLVIGLGVGLAVAFAVGTGSGSCKDTMSDSESPKVNACWKPLLEENGKGFFYRQEFVVPHLSTIGGMFHTKEEISSRQVEAPDYDYDAEVELLLERLQKLTDAQKMDIVFFDNKLNIAVALLMSMMFYGSTYEEMALYIAGETGTNTDNSIVVWKEKVRHNRIRPTTVVQHLRSGEMLNIWGDQSVNGSLFHPFIRTMPHAEHPSGSSCLCRGVHDYALQAFDFFYPDGTKGPAGSLDESTPISDSKFVQALANKVPGTGSPFPETPYTLGEMLEACSSSRLEAGLHFTQAVPDGDALCGGMGDTVWTSLRSLLHSSDDNAARAAIKSTPVGRDGATGLKRTTECRATALASEFVMPTINHTFWTTAMGMPPFASTHIVVMFWLMDVVTPALMRYETPIVARITYAITVGFWNCVAAFSGDDVGFLKYGAGNEATGGKWVPPVDSTKHTSDARSLCAVHALSAMLPTILPGEMAQAEYLAGPAALVFGLTAQDSVGIPAELSACMDDTGCMNEYIACGASTPKAMGEAIAQEISYGFKRDGWNSHGTCDDHAFCYPYMDTSGYKTDEGSCAKIGINS